MPLALGLFAILAKRGQNLLLRFSEKLPALGFGKMLLNSRKHSRGALVALGRNPG